MRLVGFWYYNSVFSLKAEQITNETWYDCKEESAKK